MTNRILRSIWKAFGLACAAFICPCVAQPINASRDSSLPNIVLILVDDLGYADIRPFGQPKYTTRHLDRLAAEGRVFTDFSVSSAVCSASRAALLTGCYHMRVGISGALGPRADIGLSPDETTIAEVCKSRGYATACIGKWHLGHRRTFLPLQQGFDEFYGLPYSNDMWPFHPSLAKLPPVAAERRSTYPNLTRIEGNEIVDPEVTAEEQAQLTTEYTQRAVRFIRQHRDRPFLLYLAHSMVHVPLFVSAERNGKSKAGLLGDVMQEVDWSVGEIFTALRQEKIDDNTLLIFTSDNGPWLSYGTHAGTAGPLREGKGTSFEGGVRVPTIMRWPRRIPPGSRCDEFAATIDVLPTIAQLIGAELPARPIDGLDISPLMFEDPPPTSPHESYYIYFSEELQAVRDRRWKLILPHKHSTLAKTVEVSPGSPIPYTQQEVEMSLFDLKADAGETHNLAAAHPEVVARLEISAREARERFGDRLHNMKGSAVRAPARAGE